MATNTEAPRPAEQTLFVRKASGLVKGWSTTTLQVFVLSTNIFLGSGAFSMLSSSRAAVCSGRSSSHAAGAARSGGLRRPDLRPMPRAGGDYVWQSRVFHSSVGFVMGATGWWFSLALGSRSTRPCA